MTKNVLLINVLDVNPKYRYLSVYIQYTHTYYIYVPKHFIINIQENAVEFVRNLHLT